MYGKTLSPFACFFLFGRFYFIFLRLLFSGLEDISFATFAELICITEVLSGRPSGEQLSIPQFLQYPRLLRRSFFIFVRGIIREILGNCTAHKFKRCPSRSLYTYLREITNRYNDSSAKAKSVFLSYIFFNPHKKLYSYFCKNIMHHQYTSNMMTH